jgi:hypothetical protein
MIRDQQSIPDSIDHDPGNLSVSGKKGFIYLFFHKDTAPNGHPVHFVFV